MQDEIQRLKGEFAAHPENYPGDPETYRVVLCDSDGALIRQLKHGGAISPTNPTFRLMRFEHGLEKEFVTWPAAP
jgi:hypothetical protein